MPIQTVGYAAPSAKAPLEFFKFERQDVGPKDVRIRNLFCGICHSDIHQAKDEWTGSIFPMVPGHEFVGEVVSFGNEVTKVKKGDIVAIGCWVGSCRNCWCCKADEEQHCPDRVDTYNGRYPDGTPTYGGYSKETVVDEHFVLKVPASLHGNLSAVAPLLCAGITMYTPMTRHKMNAPGKKIGVIGLGGLGHMAVKFGKAFGNEVTVISSSEKKKKLALEALKADNFIVHTNKEDIEKHEKYFDFLIDTVCVEKDMELYVSMLAPFGKLVTVGLPETGYRMEIRPSVLVSSGRAIIGSCVGGLKRHQEMLDFCGEKQIYAMVEVTTLDKVNEAYRRVEKSDVLFRFSIDIVKSLP